MDMIKIGNFLAELRHEQNLTQEQLGAEIGVTNKTISRWENGNYMPPVEALQKLSEFYKVSINEILSGQRLPEKEYKENAEANIKAVLKDSTFTLDERIQFFTKKWKKEHFLGMTIEMLIIIGIMIAGIVLNNGLLILGIVIGFPWSVIKYNQMMAYVEGHAYD